MSDTKIINEIKRHVTSHATDLSRNPATLGLAEHDGVLWATNRYWITPAARVAPLLEAFNLDAGKPGAFKVNSTVRRHADSAPGIGRLIGSLGDYPEPAAPVRLGGWAAYVQPSARDKFMLAVYQTADGTLLGLPDSDLAWLADITSMQMHRPQAFELGPDEHFSEVRVMTKGRGAAPVLLVADVIRTLKPASYGTDPETGKQVHRPAETENLGPRIIGALMAHKLDGKS